MNDLAILAPPSEALRSGRQDRAHVLCFVCDGQTETALRQGLSDAVSETLDVRRGGVRAAIAALQKIPTPRVLVVDVSKEDQPLSALASLSEVTEPDVRVLVVGDSDEIGFYRQITRGMGAAEYLGKPLTRDLVARHFAPGVAGRLPIDDMAQGGRMVTITPVRGGAGATTIAANLAWHLGLVARRHTLLLDADLHMGAAAMLLDAKTGPGLRRALEAPDRIDDLFIERVAQPFAERLHVLAAEETLSDQPEYVAGAVPRLLAALRRRYNFVVADVPFRPQPLCRELLDLSQKRVLVMTPTLPAIRDVLRLLALPNPPGQTTGALVVLNRLGMPGGLARRQVEDALKLRVDIAIPDLPKRMEGAAQMGEPAVAARGAFRTAIIDLAARAGSPRPPEPSGRGLRWWRRSTKVPSQEAAS